MLLRDLNQYVMLRSFFSHPPPHVRLGKDKLMFAYPIPLPSHDEFNKIESNFESESRSTYSYKSNKTSIQWTQGSQIYRSNQKIIVGKKLF